MTVSLKQFLHGLVESGLMTVDDVRAFRDSLPPNKRIASVDTLIRELVTRGKLTPYQATRIAEGRAKGLVLGNNVILEKIGEGGMGEVFRAEHQRMKRPVVVKVLPESATDSEYSRKRFQREVEAAAQLSHPNIVTAFDADEEDGTYFLVMEYVDGIDLGTLVTRDGPLSVQQAINCILQAAWGLEYAHSRGIVHRDIKPENLLLDTGGVVKILDMGLARFEELGPLANRDSSDDHITLDHQIVGTVDYMSPEQAEDSSRVDHRSDIYSLGCTMYRLLTGLPPYQGSSVFKKLLAHQVEPIPSLRAVRDDVPEDLDRIFQRMVAKKPEDRYQSMTDVIRDLQQCVDEHDFEVRDTRVKARVDIDGTSATRVLEKSSDSTTRLKPVGSTEPTVDSGAALEKAAKPAPTPKRKKLAYRAIGIDLGTTFSAIAMLDDLGRPMTLLNAEGDKTTPSVVLFEQNEVVVGKEAVKAMVTDMDMIAECAKRDLGHRLYHKVLGNYRVPPEVLEAWILNKLREDAQQQIGHFEKVVITVPAYFDETRRKATQDAGYMAGLEVMDIINEPTAAAIAFSFQHGLLAEQPGSGPQRILVYDLGGGTFDVTVMETDGHQFRTLATDGDVKLGGRDWDDRLVDYVAEQFLEQHGVDPRMEANSLGRLWRACEDAKRTLSARHKTMVACDYEGKVARIQVTRELFEELTSDLLGRTEFTTRQTLSAAGLDWDDIDRVLLVGGSTRMPAVAAMLQRLSGKMPDRSVSPDEAVAHGAALHAGLLLDRYAGQAPRFQITNVNSHSLGVVATDAATKRRQNAILIPRNTPLPVTAEQTFLTHKHGQRSVLVQIVEGESSDPDDCAQIGRCTVRGLPPDLPAHTPVKVHFHYQENGRLIVRVRVHGTDRFVEQEIARDNSMTQEQLDQWRKHISGFDPPAPPEPPSEDDGSEDDLWPPETAS